MAKFCSSNCEKIGGICDFCTYLGPYFREDGRFDDYGYCKLLDKIVNRMDFCDEFICINCEED